MKRLLAVFLTLCAVPAHADEGRCTIPVALSSVVAAAMAPAADDPISMGARLVADGRMADARAQLEPILRDPGSRSAESLALGWSLLALASASEGDLDAARPAVARSKALLDDARGAKSAGAIQLNLAWALTEVGDVRPTREALDTAARLAQQSGDATTAATALVHRALLEARIGSDPVPEATRARSGVAALGDAATRARLGVALGLALLPERGAARSDERDRLANAVLASAHADAAAAQQARELAHALGLMGELRWLRGEHREAIAALERAAAISRSVPDDPWRFRWSWRLGDALRDSGQHVKAVQRLQEAVDLLEEAKARRSLGRFSASTLARDYRRAYLDLAQAQLAESEGLAATDAAPFLRKARATLELSRSAEIEDFFRDPCLAARSARVADPEKLDATAALVHPVLLDDRLEILVSHASGIARFRVAVKGVELAREVQRLRNAVERPGSARYRASAERLHGWLISPIEAHLAKLGVTTLVFVPDGALRGLPFAALHDGKAFLAERYATAITPVATLTDPRAFGGAALRASLSGLTVASQGFSALPGAATELDRLSGILGVAALRDEKFTVEALRETLRRSPVNALHVASHGQFAPEASQTFLLAYDGHLTLAQLRAALAAGKLREEPLELITLSACQTAAGDERAALGLAGVAISAGARSAVATLWAVSDESTTQLAEGFYRALLAGRTSRAQALRSAQLALLKDERFSHPFYWAPYLLIGNWM